MGPPLLGFVLMFVDDVFTPCISDAFKVTSKPHVVKTQFLKNASVFIIDLNLEYLCEILIKIELIKKKNTSFFVACVLPHVFLMYLRRQRKGNV